MREGRRRWKEWVVVRPPARIFDADVHLHELDADLAPYFELPWRRVLEEGGLVREGARSVKGERFLDVPGESPRTVYDPILGEFPEPPPHRVTDPAVLRADLAERGVAGALVFPGRLLRAATSHDASYVGMLQRAYNRLLAERWVDPAGGVYAAIMAANQVPEAAAEEIERYARVPGFAAVYLPLAGNYPLWGDRSYEPIFAAAQETELPVVLQGTTTIYPVFPYELHHLPTALAKQTLSQPLGALANLVSLVVTGVFARYPRLRVVVNDAGLAWLPLLAGRLDHYYRFLRDEVPALAEPPSAYLRRQVYLTTHPLGEVAHRSQFLATLELLGGDQLLYGSDWPHFDADPPAALDALDLPPEVLAGILGENAAALFPGVRLG
jgi:predicted TIM-barrel fold metal-dependent hydrolase